MPVRAFAVWVGAPAAIAVVAAGCASLEPAFYRTAGPAAMAPAAVEAASGGPAEPEPADAAPPRRAVVASHPVDVVPSAGPGVPVWHRALSARGLRIVVSTEGRALWLLRDTAVLLSAPVAVGMEEGFTYGGRTYDFRTPIGQRRVLAKAETPIWTPPDWHYFEKVVERGLEPVQLRAGMRVMLEDSTFIEVRGDQVGRINRFGNFAPFTPGVEIIFGGRIFIPPFGTAQRRIPDVLGTHKLELGDGYLIHGTNVEDSIGDPVSHGCVRMYNDDVARLYAMVPVGTPVFIY
jgi:hypothetical protein